MTSVGEMPSHGHQMVYSGTEGGVGWLPQGREALALINGATTTNTIGNGVFQDRGISFNGAYIANFPALQNTGSGQKHQMVQPYSSCYFYKRLT